MVRLIHDARGRVKAIERKTTHGVSFGGFSLSFTIAFGRDLTRQVLRQEHLEQVEWNKIMNAGPLEG